VVLARIGSSIMVHGSGYPCLRIGAAKAFSFLVYTRQPLPPRLSSRKDALRWLGRVEVKRL
jgi:hypothetical protein